MKILLSFALLCFAWDNGMGAPTTARYMYVKCVPSNGDANCQTHRSQEMAWSPELPSRLPALEAQYIVGDSVEEQGPVGSAENEAPKMETARFLSEEGSGNFEGSADYLGIVADGSGSDWTENERNQYEDVGEYPVRDLIGESQPPEQELKEDHLLQL